VKRVNVVVEGPTEKSFIDNVLAEALWPHEVYLTARILGIPGKKGGRPSYERLRGDVIRLLRGDPTAFCFMMLDLTAWVRAFQDLQQVRQASKKAFTWKQPLRRMSARRFLSFAQMRGSSRISSCTSLRRCFSAARANSPGQLINLNLKHTSKPIRDGFPTPEHINDGPETAPSKQVLACCPRYRKVIDGTLAAQAIGVDRMRRECPHFRSWLEQLESL
jgi:hypothetical protein